MLVAMCREAAVYERKIRKARAKRNEDLARRLIARRPTYKLDHLVKERHISFTALLCQARLLLVQIGRHQWNCDLMLIEVELLLTND